MSHNNVLDPIGFAYYPCAEGDLLYVAINTFASTPGRGLDAVPTAVQTVSYEDADGNDLSGTLVGTPSIDGENVLTPGIPISTAGTTIYLYKVTVGSSELTFRFRPSAIDPNQP